MAGLGLTYMFSTCAFVLFFYFLIRILNISKTTKEILPFFSLASIFLSLGIAHFIVSWFDYFWWNNGWIILDLHKIFTLTELIGAGSMLFFMEYALKKTRYLLTSYIIVLIVISFIINDFETLNLTMILGILPAILFSLPMIYLLFIKPTSGSLRQRMYLSLLGTLIMSAGLLFRSINIIKLLGLSFYLIGTSMAILGMCLIGYSFSALSTFTDINWKEKLREIYVIDKKGICLYAFSFEKNIDLDDALNLDDSIMIGGVFSSIDKLLSKMMHTNEDLKLIDYKNLKIMLERGAEVIGVLILNEESSFLQYKLKVFLNEFETFFKGAIENFIGNVTTFKLARGIVQHVFELKT